MSNIFYRAEYVVIHSSAPELESRAEAIQALLLEDFEMVSRSGIVANSSGISEHSFSDRPRAEVHVRDVRDDLGEWMGVGRSRAGSGQDEFVVFGDAYGYCPIFYSFVPGTGLIVSDSFYGQIAGLRAVGSPITHDLTHYAATMTSRLSHFQNPSVDRTMAHEIRILPLDRALYVTDSAVQAVSRSVVGGSSAVMDYDEAVNKGIEFGVGVARALGSIPELTPTLFLSGGVDSRLVLAFLAAAGVQSKVSVSTVDPRTWNNPSTSEVVRRDMEIADQIRRDFGMPWAEAQPRTVVPFDFQDSLAYQQSYRSNFGFVFSPSNGHTMSNTQQISLRGGGGELLRTTATGEKTKSSVEKFYGAERVTAAPHDYLAKWVNSRSAVPSPFQNEVSQYMTDTIKALPGGSVEEIMNRQYLHNRNRTHFGHIRQSQSSNNVALHLLSNPFLLRAQELSAFGERKNADTVRKLYRQLAPELLEYPFESAASTEKLSVEPLRSISVDRRSWSSSVDSAKLEAGAAGRPPEFSSEQRGIRSPYPRQETAVAYINSGFRMVEHRQDSEERTRLRQVHKTVYELMAAGKMDVNTVTAKLASAIDLWFPMTSMATPVHFHCRALGENESLCLRKSRPEHRQVPSDGWNNTSIVPFEVNIAVKSGVLVATIAVDGPIPAGATFAFYLYRNGKKVKHQWYSDSTTAVFRDVVNQGTFFVRGFMRVREHAIPGYPVESNILEIE